MQIGAAGSLNEATRRPYFLLHGAAYMPLIIYRWLLTVCVVAHPRHRHWKINRHPTEQQTRRLRSALTHNTLHAIRLQLGAAQQKLIVQKIHNAGAHRHTKNPLRQQTRTHRAHPTQSPLSRRTLHNKIAGHTPVRTRSRHRTRLSRRRRPISHNLTETLIHRRGRTTQKSRHLTARLTNTSRTLRKVHRLRKKRRHMRQQGANLTAAAAIHNRQHAHLRVGTPRQTHTLQARQLGNTRIQVEILRRTPLFANLDDAAFALLTDDIQEIDLSRNAVLFYEGDQDDQLFAVLSGKVKLGRTAADGRENMVAIMGPGDVFGEMALFDPSPRSTNAVAVSETRLAAIKHESFKRAQQLDPTISDQVIKTLARRLRHANEALADLVFSDVPGRLAKALLDLADRFGRPATDGVLVAHELTQEELAQLVGASRETVNKALAEFVSRGWIRLEARAVVILDLPRLRQRSR